MLDADVEELAETGLIKATRLNYVYGNTYVLSSGAADYIEKWRAQRQDLPEMEPTGWVAVDEAVAALRKRLTTATSGNDYKAVGHECVTILEALGRAAFDTARHLPDGEQEPSRNDGKRRLELFTKAVSSGNRFAHVRKIINEAYAQGHQTKHRDSSDRLDAEVSADPVVMLVSIIKRFADAEQRAAIEA